MLVSIVILSDSHPNSLRHLAVEFIGYAARAGASNNTGKLMPYIIQSIFVLVAPTLFAATVYMVLARIIRAVVDGEKLSPIRMELITRIFVTCDVVTFFIQGGGGGMMAVGSLTKIGQDIVLAGLVLQILTFALFVFTAVSFEQRIRKTTPTPASRWGDVSWKQHLRSLYCMSAMILVRSIFRVVEYGLGNDGYLATHEWSNYIFDAVPMLIVMLCFAVWYPNQLQPSLSTSDPEFSMS